MNLDFLYFHVADNTYPNLMPLLTGYTENTASMKCHPSYISLDNCHFIWTTLRRKGFATAYAEDTSYMATFDYQKRGFLRPPTDHYLRPFSMAIEKHLKIIKKAGLSYCIGRHQAGEYIYNFGIEFAKRYQNQSYFGLFWTNSFSHSFFNTATTMDTTILAYFKDMEKQGILDTAAVVFFSDHGRRWGPLLHLEEGFLEERLPMFYISLPKWIKEDYPDLVRNLEVNQGRLTTPFDIYMTVKHLTRLALPKLKFQQASDCANAQSILKIVPENRTCEDACIPQSWCTCLPYIKQAKNSVLVQNVTQLILNEMNNYLQVRNLSTLCSELSLKKITDAWLRQNESTPVVSTSTLPTYKIEFTTNPKTKPLTEFSATVDYDVKEQRIIANVEDISRQSEYASTAQCVNDKQAKKYCICRSSLLENSDKKPQVE
ncbi:uncharacterized protein LOC131994712 [Stomoxys calcitrans]|uniref:uncharacterized protein LOC131994712 n=1 Tax=Stomoxys calcitrans TaxID=35570 RepID=UPI0027E342EB|nr:uncharacterized protein LOC131994712 [Stomoxys calcitrans]